jgi:hypothetical protein
MVNHAQRAHRTGRDALAASGARGGIHEQAAAPHVDSGRWAERHAQAAGVAGRVIDDRNRV